MIESALGEEQMAIDDYPLGVFTSIDSGFGVPLQTAKELGVPSVHVHSPHDDNINDESADRFLQACADAGITVTVLFAGFDGDSYASIAETARTVGLVPKETRSYRAGKMREIAAFGRRIGCDVMGTHIGFVPQDRTSDDYRDLVKTVQRLLDELADYGQRLHLETGQESARHLLDFIDDVARDNLKINFDPANMILYGTGDPIEALKTVGEFVGSIHCKDAVAAPTDVRGTEWGREVALGEGEVGMKTYLETLKAVGYVGPLTIERELSEDPVQQRADIEQAITLLTALRDEVFGD